jgi:hypothetical protein
LAEILVHTIFRVNPLIISFLTKAEEYFTNILPGLSNFNGYLKCHGNLQHPALVEKPIKSWLHYSQVKIPNKL